MTTEAGTIVVPVVRVAMSVARSGTVMTVGRAVRAAVATGIVVKVVSGRAVRAGSAMIVVRVVRVVTVLVVRGMTVGRSGIG
ncbi:hypothetical protein SAMN05444920_1742, partial [Nonomuraea solani]